MVDVKPERFKLFLIALVALELLAIAALTGQENLSKPAQENEAYGGEPENPTDFSQPVEGEIPYLLKPEISEFTDGYNYKIPGYWVRTNSHGLRGEEFKEEPESGVKRILVVGDSHTFGWGVNRSERFTALLGDRLDSQTGQDYQVINAGVPGWGMKDYYSFLKERGLSYRPEIVVVAFGFNDVLSAEKNNELQEKAERSVPQNATDRSEKVLQKNLELKRAYFSNASIEDSDLGHYLKKISALGERNDTKIVFYYVSSIPDSKRDRYENITRNYGSAFISGNMKFAETEEKYYTLPGKDSHYNELGHLWMAEKLYEGLSQRGKDILEVGTNQS